MDELLHAAQGTDEGDTFILVQSQAEPTDVIRALERAISIGDREWPDEVGEVFDPVPTPRGIAIYTAGWPDIRLFASSMAAGLDAAGISGVIGAPSDLNNDSPIVGNWPWKRDIPVLETRCTLRGTPFPPHPGVVAPEAVLEKVGHTVIDWCAALPGRVSMAASLGVGSFVVDPAPLRDCWSVAAAATEVPLRVSVEAADSRFRVGYLDQAMGQAIFLQGPFAAGDRDSAAEQLEESRLILGAVPWATYGYAKQTNSCTTAISTRTLVDAWVPVPHVDVRTLPLSALDATRVPDVFGLQLLGSDHALPGLDDEEWLVVGTDAGQWIVEHRDVTAWLKSGGPPLDLIQRARADLAPLLCRSTDVSTYRRA